MVAGLASKIGEIDYWPEIAWCQDATLPKTLTSSREKTSLEEQRADAQQHIGVVAPGVDRLLACGKERLELSAAGERLRFSELCLPIGLPARTKRFHQNSYSHFICRRCRLFETTGVVETLLKRQSS